MGSFYNSGRVTIVLSNMQGKAVPNSDVCRQPHLNRCQKILAMFKHWGAVMGVLLVLAPCPSPAFAASGSAPSTFGTTIGPALLCLDHIDPSFFWSYLNEYFGPPYKNEGGAYWFKVQATLWGAQISDVLVSDGSGPLIFLAAAATPKPDDLSEAIAGRTGISYTKEEQTRYSPMLSGVGSKIVYFGKNSKIYCAKYNLDSGR